MVLEEVGVKPVRGKDSVCLINPVIPKSDKHLISPYNITSESHINVMRIKEMITNQRTLDCWTNYPCQLLSKCTENSLGNMDTDVS